MTEYRVPHSAEQSSKASRSLVLDKTSSAGETVAQTSLALEKMSISGIDDPKPLVWKKTSVSVSRVKPHSDRRRSSVLVAGVFE